MNLDDIFLKVLEKIQITGDEATEVAEIFNTQVKEKFFERVKNEKGVDESMLAEEVEKMTGGEISKIYGEVFKNHLTFFVKGMYDLGDITDQELKELDEYYNNLLGNLKLQNKMGGDTNHENVLKNLST